MACVCFNEHLENGNAVFSPASWSDCNMVGKSVSLLQAIQTGIYIILYIICCMSLKLVLQVLYILEYVFV